SSFGKVTFIGTSPAYQMAAGPLGTMQNGFPWIGWSFSSPARPPSSTTWTPTPTNTGRSEPPPLRGADMRTVSCRWCGTEYQTTCEHDVYCSQVCMDAEAALMETAGEGQDLPTIEEGVGGPLDPVPCKPGPPLL